MADNEKWCSMNEIAEYLDVSRETILNWIEKRGMPAIKAGRLWKFQKTTVDNWLKSGGGIEPLISLYDIQDKAMHTITQLFLQIYINYTTPSINTIKDMLSILIHGIAGQFSTTEFSIGDEEEMTKEALCEFLIWWIKSAPNTKQTCGSFVRQKYKLKDEPEDTIGDDVAYERKMARAVKEYYRSLDPNFKVPTKKAKDVVYHSFIALCFADYYCSKNSSKSSDTSFLKLYRDLVNNKDSYENTNKPLCNEIIEGYKNYFEALRLASFEKDNKALVTKMLTLIDFERMKHYLLSYQITMAVYNNHTTPEHVIDMIKNYYQCIPCREDPDKGIPFSSIRHSKEFVEKACSNALTVKEKNKVKNARIIIHIAVATFIGLCPQCCLLSWTNTTFDDAAYFLKEDYKFDELYDGIDTDFILDRKNQYAKATMLKDTCLKVIDKQKLNEFRNTALLERHEENIKGRTKTTQRHHSPQG